MCHSDLLLANDLELSNHARFLKKHGLYSAALYYKNLNEPIERRAARACRYNLEKMPCPDYFDGQQLMVSKNQSVITAVPEDDINDYGFRVNVQGDCVFNEEKFGRITNECITSVDWNIAYSIIQNCAAANARPYRCRYDHSGLHNVADFEYVLNNGILSYRKDVLKMLETITDPEERMFQEGLLDVIDGIEVFINRYVAKLEKTEEEFSGDKNKLRKLINALKKVPLYPAESFYESFVSCNAVMYFAEAYEPGRIDHYLYPYYASDLAKGKTSADEAYSLIRELLENIDHRCSHPGTTHVTIGGTNKDGTATYNELTEIVMKAIRGLRAPNVTLRVRRDMPQHIWDICLENFGKGYAQPAIVNEELYIDRLTKDYDVPFDDAVNYVFGGCAEVLIQGKTTCDSTWVAFNMLDIFENTLYNQFLRCDSFEEFYKNVKDDYKITIREMSEQINIRQFAFGLHSPMILSTLLIGDCIQNSKSFTKGGSRYNFDSANIYASTNVINSLYTIKQYYDGKLGNFSREDFLNALVANFSNNEELYNRCKRVTKFGNYNEELNMLAHDITDHVFSEIMAKRCYRSNEKYTGRFMCAVILWTTWITCGSRIGATPDGRLLGEPTADNCGPMQGTDTEGPTSVMGAALSLAQKKCAGTCVLNLRLDPANFKTKESTSKVQMLFETYFSEGGSHVQVNVVSQEALLEAIADPENHKDIIVRVGGFSDNFVLLSKNIQNEIIKRTQHSL